MNGASPLKQLGWLLGVTLAAAILLSYPAVLIAGLPGLQGLGLAIVLCLLPGLITVGCASLVTSQMARVWVTMAGMLVRMLVVLAGVLVLRELQPQLGLKQFHVWLIVMYSLLLLTETWLLLPRSS